MKSMLEKRSFRKFECVDEVTGGGLSFLTKAETIEHIGKNAAKLGNSCKIEQQMSRKKLQAYKRCLGGNRFF